VHETYNGEQHSVAELCWLVVLTKVMLCRLCQWR